MTRILAADIGGTNSRFALFEARGTDPSELRMAATTWLETTEAHSLDDLLTSLREADADMRPEEADAMVLAVAGAVQRGVYANPPNIDFEVDVTDPSSIGCPVTLINDFAAQGYAVRTPAVDDASPVKPGQAQQGAAVGVIGAGTGLGHCALVETPGGRHKAVPSEMGHAGFPLVDEAEMDFGRFVMDRTEMPYVYTELVVSGRGLSLVHEYMTGERLDPPDAAPFFAEGSRQLAWFARFYGRAARQYALAVLALGGVFVAGGVAAKNPILVTDAAFSAEFVNQPKYGWMLESIPIHLNTNQESGLWGAAFHGLQIVSS
jgi:glucokinase